MTKANKVNTNTTGEQSVRLLIELKGSSTQNVLVPTSTTQSVQGFMGSMENKFGCKFDQVMIASNGGHYKVENHYTVGQCFKDFDHVLLQAAKA